MLALFVCRADAVKPEVKSGNDKTPAASVKVPEAKPNQEIQKNLQKSQLTNPLKNQPLESPKLQATAGNKDLKTGTSSPHTVKSGRKASRGTAVLVPPPPPSIPTDGMVQTPLVLSGEMIDYMSKTDLNELKTTLTARLARDRKKLDDNRERSLDTKKKAQTFEQLFSEGVVSRKELETAKEDAIKVEEDLPQLEDSVKELDAKLSRINKRLTVLEAKKKPDGSGANRAKEKTAKSGSLHQKQERGIAASVLRGT